MKYSVESLQRQLQNLRLAETSKELPFFLRKAESHSWSYQELLREMLRYEEKRREEKCCAFPYQKSLAEFNIEELPSLSARQLRQLKELNWLDESFNLIFLSPPGVGKPHIAIGLGLEVINKGQCVSFVSMGELVPLLKSEEYLWKSQLKMIRTPDGDLIFIDDLCTWQWIKTKQTFFPSNKSFV